MLQTAKFSSRRTDAPTHTCQTAMDALSPLVALPAAAVAFAIVALVMCNAVVYVSPKRRLLTIDAKGRVSTIDGAGYILVNPLRVVNTHPFKRLTDSAQVPVPGTTFRVDPPACDVSTSDGVTGTVDVSVDLEIGLWSADELVGDSICFVTRACGIVNQWVAEMVGQSTALDVASYHRFSSFLNTQRNLDQLNTRLVNARVRAVNVLIDRGGVKLSKLFTDAVERETQLRSERNIRAMQDANNLEAARRKAADDAELAVIQEAHAMDAARRKAAREAEMQALGDANRFGAAKREQDAQIEMRHKKDAADAAAFERQCAVLDRLPEQVREARLLLASGFSVEEILDVLRARVLKEAPGPKTFLVGVPSPIIKMVGSSAASVA